MVDQALPLTAHGLQNAQGPSSLLNTHSMYVDQVSVAGSPKPACSSIDARTAGNGTEDQVPASPSTSS